MVEKMLPSKPKPIQNLIKYKGITMCPCGLPTVILRYRQDGYGTYHFIRRCMRGHWFSSYQQKDLEKMRGDLVPMKEIVRKYNGTNNN